MVTPSKVAFCLIFLEMSIFITYYKDVMFALTTMVNFFGMYYTSYEKLDPADKHFFWNHHKNKVNNFASTDYPRLLAGTVSSTEDAPAKVIQNWVTGCVLLNIIWIVVTLVADWRSCFYRKAFQYKRRVDNAVK